MCIRDSRFNNKDWIHGGAGSPYEFKMATNYACAMRVDNYSVRNLRLSLSGYVGTSGRNTLNAVSYTHLDVYKRQDQKIARDMERLMEKPL